MSYKSGRGLPSYPPWGREFLLSFGVCPDTLCLPVLLLWLMWEQCLGWDPQTAGEANLPVSAVCNGLASARHRTLGWVPAAWHRPCWQSAALANAS